MLATLLGSHHLMASLLWHSPLSTCHPFAYLRLSMLYYPRAAQRHPQARSQHADDRPFPWPLSACPLVPRPGRMARLDGSCTTW